MVNPMTSATEVCLLVACVIEAIIYLSVELLVLCSIADNRQFFSIDHFAELGAHAPLKGVMTVGMGVGGGGGLSIRGKPLVKRPCSVCVFVSQAPHHVHTL